MNGRRQHRPRLGRRQIQEVNNKRLKHSALDSWLTSACFSTEIRFTDNFISAWNFREHSKQTGLIQTSGLRHALGNRNTMIGSQDKRANRETPFISLMVLRSTSPREWECVPLQDPALPPTPTPTFTNLTCGGACWSSDAEAQSHG